MRILHVVNHVRRSGNGIVNVAVDLACAHSGAGHAVAVASSGGDYEALLEGQGVGRFRLDLDGPLRRLARARSLGLPRAYRRVVAEFGPDVVHVHTTAALLLAAVLRRAGEYALVSHLHNEFERKARLMSMADLVIAVSHATAASAAARGFPQEKVRTVLNGTVGSVRGKSDAAAAGGDGGVRLEGRPIVCVAGLNARKGVADLIVAFDNVARRFPDARLYLVGDGPDRATLAATAARTPAAGRIHFVGFRPDARAYLRAAQVFVTASSRDPCSLAVIEAMECGCPIVATAVDGTPELLGYGRAGLLVRPGDRHALAEAIGALLADPAECARLRAAADALVPNLSWQRVARETLGVYEEAVRRRVVQKGRPLDPEARSDPPAAPVGPAPPSAGS